jgi:glycosyltransferase involved in cell wall biosynthesis
LRNVSCKANLTDEELLGEYQSASCYLMTAEDATANNALLESMSCGLPIVAERVGGIPEYTTSQCAFLTGQGDVSEIAEAIVGLKESSGLRRQMSEAARCRALELDWTHVADMTRAVYSGIAVD